MMRGILTFAVIVTALAATPFAAAMQDKPGQAQPAATAVNGIGAATAKQIIEYRQKNNGFKKVEELMNIKGIGEKSFLKLKSLVTITPPKAGER
jgi:competence ComEA-like helix-hairpin-helix protein